MSEETLMPNKNKGFSVGIGYAKSIALSRHCKGSGGFCVFIDT